MKYLIVLCKKELHKLRQIKRLYPIMHVIKFDCFQFVRLTALSTSPSAISATNLMHVNLALYISIIFHHLFILLMRL